MGTRQYGHGGVEIIGLCGRAGSGKSSVAKYILREYGATLISFAGPLKKMARDIWGFSPQQVYGEADAKETIDLRWGITPRKAMQLLGQSARDHLGHYVWVEAALNSIEEPGLYVIEDVRYLTEADTLSKMGIILRLHCSDSISGEGESTHPSEVEVDLIPAKQITAELHGSRAQGLPHLYGLVDAALRHSHRR